MRTNVTIPTEPEAPATPASPAALIVRPLATSDEDAWTRYVDRHADATLFHTLEWRTIIGRTFAHDHHYLLAWRGEVVCGVLPLTQVSSIFFGTTLISSPFGVYGGILADDAEVAGALVEAARSCGSDAKAKYVELRHLTAPGVDLPTNDLYCTFIEDVPSDAEGCLARLPRKARAEVRKTLKNEALVLEEETVGLDEFHRLFSLNKRKLGSPLFPSSLFWHIRDVLGDRAPLHVVRHEGEMVAVVMSFIHGKTLMPYYSGAIPGAERLRANNFMYFKLMEWASAQGLERFDFGRSRRDTGSFSFKKNQGFEPKPLSYEYILIGDSEIPSLNASNPKYEMAKKVFSRMPLWMAQKVGSWLVKRAPF